MEARDSGGSGQEGREWNIMARCRKEEELSDRGQAAVRAIRTHFPSIERTYLFEFF